MRGPDMKSKMNLILIILVFILLPIFASPAVSLPDTVWVDCIYDVPPASKVVVKVQLYTTQSLVCLIIPLTFKSDLNNDIVCDSVQWSQWFWSTPASVGYSGDGSSYIDSVEKTIGIWAMWMLDSLLSQDTASVICTIHFTTGHTWNPQIPLIIDTTFIQPSNTLTLWNSSAERLKPEFFSGGFFTNVREVDIKESPINNLTLFQNYPNPFNSTTMIRFALSSRSRVRMEIFNVLGQKIKTLIDEQLKAGCKEVSWDGKDGKGEQSPTGIYFCKIKVGEFSQSRKMLLLR
jgi:hypothetical protein